MGQVRASLRTAAVLGLACAASLPAAGAARASGGLQAADSLLLAAPAVSGQAATFSGIVGGAAPRPQVEVQIAQSNGTWKTIARTRAKSSGSFTATWRASGPGRFLVRAVTSPAAGEAPTAVLTVMRKTVATWYDQSGSQTACGVRLTRKTLGVAHKTLPCGTVLEFALQGRSVTAPGIDRGPYAKGVSYDLTIAAARQLRFVATGRGTVGVLEADTPITAPAPAPGLAAARRVR